MTTVAVTCIKNGRADSFGRPLVSGTYYPNVEINTAAALWNSGYVSVADASVFDQDPLSGTSPLDDFNVARALAITRQPEQTSANLAAELAAIGMGLTVSSASSIAQADGISARSAGVWAGDKTNRLGAWDNDIGFSRIAGSVWYVSNEAADGWAIGDDSNSGLSRAAPKLTVAAAVTAARDGDTVVVKSSATVYELGSGLTLGRKCTILPTTWRGVTLRSSNANAPINLGQDDITFGALIIDSTMTTSGLAVSAIRSTAQRQNLRLIGTQLKGNTNSLLLLGSVKAYGASFTSIGASRALVSITTGHPADIVLDQCDCDGRVYVRPSVTGVTFSISRSTIAGYAPSGTWALLDVVGCSSVTASDNVMTCDGTSDAIGVWVVPSSTIACSSVQVLRNSISLGVSSALVGGYGIGVGGENNTTTNNVSEVNISGNDVSHVNHGIFVGYGIKNATVRSNVVRDVVIGLIRKGYGASGGSVRLSSNVVIGGVLTGGALRAKENIESQPTVYEHNTVIFDAASDAGGQHILATDVAQGVAFRNNILYAPSISVKTCVAVTDTSAASFAGNDYFAGSFETGSWVTPGYAASNSFAAWKAAVESTALNVDPGFSNFTDGDYRLGASSGLLAAAISPGSLDFDDLPLLSAVGAFRAV